MSLKKSTAAAFPGFITGKPADGGSLGRTEATGYGVVFTLREALKELGIRPEDTRPASRDSAMWPTTPSNSTNGWEGGSSRSPVGIKRTSVLHLPQA